MSFVPDVSTSVSFSSKGVDPQEFRRVMGNLVAGVTVVTSRAAGLDYAMTASSFTSVSLEPALVLVCLQKTARIHKALSSGARWGVSILAAESAHIAARLADPTRCRLTHLQEFSCTRGAASDALLLDEALATVECETSAIYDAGDHDIAVGSVLAVGRSHRAGPPLAVHAGVYRRLAAE